MTMHIPILPLKVLQDLVHQKCIIPEEYFPKGALPGSWAKCIWDDTNEGYSICQLFSKDPELHHDPFCYLDTNVGSKITLKSPEILKDLKILENKRCVTWIEIIVELDEEFFVKNFKRFTKVYLTNIVNILLQSLHFTINSFIVTDDLKKWGISNIHIIAAPNIEPNHIFTINDNTKINFNDIRIASQIMKEPKKVLPDAFGNAYYEVKEFLEILKKKHKSKMMMMLPANALIVGPNGCGKSTLIETIIEDLNCNCFNVRIDKILGQYPGETEQNLKKIFHAAQSFQKHFNTETIQLLILEDLHLLCPSKLTNSEDILNSGRITCHLMNLIDDLYKTNSQLICLSSTTSMDEVAASVCRPGRFDQSFNIILPNESMRLKLLLNIFATYQEVYKNLEIPNEIQDYIAKHTQGYVIADLQLLVRNIIQMFIKSKDSTLFEVTKEILYHFKPTSMHGVDVTVVKPTEGFESIAGMDALKKDLKISLLAAFQHQEAFARFGLKMPKGLLLYGPPGCGKTKFAKCLAYEANMTFITTSGAEVYSPYVGQAERFLTKIFDTARRHAPCLIFFDEIDTLVGKRTIGGNQGNVQLRILSTMLTEMDGIQHNSSALILNPNNINDIMVVAATNRPDMLDDALIRPGRFSKIIHVPPPDFESRRQLLLMRAKISSFANDVDIDDIAKRTENFSGADLQNLCNEAALYALEKNIDANEITLADFNEILRTVKPSLTKAQIEQYYTII